MPSFHTNCCKDRSSVRTRSARLRASSDKIHAGKSGRSKQTKKKQSRACPRSAERFPHSAEHKEEVIEDLRVMTPDGSLALRSPGQACTLGAASAILITRGAAR